MLPKIIDLFSGCGGLALGFEKAGFDIVAGIELMPEACKTISYNLSWRYGKKETHICGDITEIEASVFKNSFGDEGCIVIGGPPCQAYSMAGRGKLRSLGEDRVNIKDARGYLYQDFLRFVFELEAMGKELPRFLLMENVTNILSKPHAADFGDWKATLENLGYYNKIYRLNAQNFGIPQKRERAYMISILCKNNAETIEQVEKYFEEHNLEKDEATHLKQRDLRLKDILCLDYDNVPQYKEEADASKPNDTPSRRKIWEDNELLYDGKEVNDIIVNTVTTKQDRNPNSGLIIYKNWARGKTKWRYLTPRECFKLMGFDESDFDRIISDNPMVTKNRHLYSTEKLIKLAGNSIVVDVLEAIFRQIMDINGKILGERK